MNHPGEFRHNLSRVTELRDAGQFDQALREVEALLRNWPGNAHLHLLRASLVQLQEEPRHELDEAKAALESAVALEGDSPAAAIELGYFLDHVEDAPAAASGAFAAAIAAARKLLIDALVGQARALQQQNRREETLLLLAEALRLSNLESCSDGQGCSEAAPAIDSLRERLQGMPPESFLTGQIADLIDELAAANPA